MLKRWVIEPPVTVNIEMVMGQYIVYTQGGRQERKRSANAAALFQESVLHMLAKGIVGIGNRRIVHVAAHNYRVGALSSQSLQLPGLLCPGGKGMAHLVYERTGGGHRRIAVQAFNGVELREFRGVEHIGTELGGIYPDGIAIDEHIRFQYAAAAASLTVTAGDLAGLYHRVARKEDDPVTPGIPMDLIGGKIVMRIPQALLYGADVIGQLRIIIGVKFLQAEQVRAGFVQRVHNGRMQFFVQLIAFYPHAAGIEGHYGELGLRLAATRHFLRQVERKAYQYCFKGKYDSGGRQPEVPFFINDPDGNEQEVEAKQHREQQAGETAGPPQLRT